MEIEASKKEFVSRYRKYGIAMYGEYNLKEKERRPLTIFQFTTLYVQETHDIELILEPVFSQSRRIFTQNWSTFKKIKKRLSMKRKHLPSIQSGVIFPEKTKFCNVWWHACFLLYLLQNPRLLVSFWSLKICHR